MAYIGINDVTSGTADGSGVFDVLMRSVDAQLDKQYSSGRIKGTEYATVYVGALQAVLQQSIAFILAEQKVEKEVDVMTEQIAASKADTIMKQAANAEQIAASKSATKVKEDQSTATNAVYAKQVLGFSQDYKLKVAKAMFDIRTTGLTQGMEGIVSEGADPIAQSLLADAGLPYTTAGGKFFVDPA